MRARGHDVHVHFFDNADVVKRGGGKLQAGISAVYNKSSAKEIIAVATRIRPDVVHVHNFFFAASPSILIAIKKLDIPLVVTIQNYRLICANALLMRNHRVCELCIHSDFPWWGVKYKCYHDSAMQSAAVGAMAAIHKRRGTWRNAVDLYITPSEFLRAKLIGSSFNVPQEKITVKRNFITDAGEGDAHARKDYYLFVGRLSPEKGVDTLLEAWRALPQQQLIIAGDGPEKTNLEEKFGGLDNIVFLGHQQKEDVLNLMRKSRALIFPSIWYEGLPLTIVEALSTGTPVIGSDLGAVSEMIKHGYNGMLFEAGSPQKLSSAINDFNMRVATGNVSIYHQARKSFMENYHPEKCYNDIMKIYRQAIGA